MSDVIDYVKFIRLIVILAPCLYSCKDSVFFIKIHIVKDLRAENAFNYTPIKHHLQVSFGLNFNGAVHYATYLNIHT